jgi:hypothetical protein
MGAAAAGSMALNVAFSETVRRSTRVTGESPHSAATDSTPRLRLSTNASL